MREIARLEWMSVLAASLTILGWTGAAAAQPPVVSFPIPVEHGVEVECSLALRPHVTDPRTGLRTLASPDRYELRTTGEGATVRADGDAWTVRSASMRVEYQLVERATGLVVAHDRVQLACGRTLPPSDDAVELVPGRVFFGATVTTGPDDAGSCGGEGGPQQWYVVHLSAPAQLGLRLVSEFDATLYVREGSIHGPEVLCRDTSARLETFDMHLPEGVYYVAVDGTRSFGRYRLVAFETPVDPRALDGGMRGELRSRDVVDDELVPATSRYHASCGGTQAPEHLYAIRVDRPARYSFRLASRFDSALYVLRADGAEVGCRSTLGRPSGWREAHVAVDLVPGVYWVVVDGESGLAGAGMYRVSALELPSPE